MKKVTKTNQNIKKQIIKREIYRIFFITLGALIAGFIINCFLVPNHMIDGGITGISIMLSYITHLNLGLFLVCINIPFIFLALQKMGKLFVAKTIYGIIILSLSVNIFKTYQATHDLLLATVFGGLVLGVGVGLILKNNAALDGTEILSLRLAKKLGFSVGEIIMFFNVFIYIASGFLFGINRGMYSVLVYFITFKVIDVILEGINESKAVTIISDKSKLIGESIMKNLDVGITYIHGKGGFTGKDKTLIYCVISRLEIAKMKELVKAIDTSAFLAVETVHEVEGVKLKTKQIRIKKKKLRKKIRKSKKLLKETKKKIENLEPIAKDIETETINEVSVKP